MNRTITTVQAMMILMLTMGLMNHVIVLPSILAAAKRDSWVSVLFTGAIFLLWIPGIYLIIKKTNRQHIIEWLKENAHSSVAWIVRALLVCLLLLNTFVTLFSTFTWVSNSYMTQTPMIVLAIPFLILCFFAAESGIKTIAIASGVLLPFVIAFGLFIMTANFHYKDYSLLLPVFEHGFRPILKGSIYLGGGLVEIFFLVLIQQHVRTDIKFKGVFLLSLFIIWINLGPIVGAITEFGPVQAAEIKNPAFSQWRLLIIGKYLSRLDFLSIYQWLSGAFVRVSLSIFLLCDLFQIKSKKNSVVFLIIILIGFTVTLMLPINDPAFKYFINTYYFQMSLLGFLIITFIINVILIAKRKV